MRWLCAATLAFALTFTIHGTQGAALARPAHPSAALPTRAHPSAALPAALHPSSPQPPALGPGVHRAVDPAVEVVTTTSDLADALSRQPDLRFRRKPSGHPVIKVDPTMRFQTIRGFGAALTDSSAWLIHDRLDPVTRASLLQDLFTPAGIDLSFLRMPIGASDYTATGSPYTYDDSRTPDPNLLRFSIAHDLAYIVPTLRDVLALNPGEFLLATPWSPPAWMKRNDRLDNIAHSGQILPADLPVLARYIVRFLLAYRWIGIPVSAVTPQNEPGNATSYPGAEMSAATQAKFIASDLAPAIRDAGLATRIYGYDYGWARNSTPAALALSHSRAAAALAGIASHCYFGPPTVLSTFHAANPRLEQIVSECSPGITPFSTAELAISSMRNWASVIALWNLALDAENEPVQSPNTGCPNCRGLVTIASQIGAVKFTRDYYELGQFSAFVKPGAVRIASNSFTHYAYTGRGLDVASPTLDDVAFQNPDGSEVLVAYDNGPRQVRFDIESAGRYATCALDPGQTVTIIWNRPAAREPYTVAG